MRLRVKGTEDPYSSCWDFTVKAGLVAVLVAGVGIVSTVAAFLG